MPRPYTKPRTRGLLAAFVAAALLGPVASPGAADTRFPHNAVAVAAGAAITKVRFDHWMRIAAQGHASTQPGSPVIVPTDPPAFHGCITRLRHQDPTLGRTHARQLKIDCRHLFRALTRQTLDFLIKAEWYAADAGSEKITITKTEVTRALEQDKREQFSTPHAFRTFLRMTGQTVEDVRFRARVSLTFARLLKHEPANLDGEQKERRLTLYVTRQYRSVTHCARYYVINDCAQ